MKKNVIINLLVCLFSIYHLIEIILFKNLSVKSIVIINYLLIGFVTGIAAYINYKYNAEDKEFLRLQKVIILTGLTIYIIMVLFGIIINISMEQPVIRIIDLLGLSYFGTNPIDSNTALNEIGNYYNIFHNFYFLFEYYHDTVSGQFCMAQTYSLLVLCYNIYIWYSVGKLNKQDIFYNSDQL